MVQRNLYVFPGVPLKAVLFAFVSVKEDKGRPSGLLPNTGEKLQNPVPVAGTFAFRLTEPPQTASIPVLSVPALATDGGKKLSIEEPAISSPFAKPTMAKEPPNLSKTEEVLVVIALMFIPDISIELIPDS